MNRTIVGIRKVAPFDLYDISVENDHCFELDCGVIAHNSMYPKDIISGGTAIMLSSNQAFIISKSQEKEGTDLAGWKYTINVEKSRFVREKSKLPFIVLYDSGIQKWSGLFDLAVDAGLILKPKQGWYQLVDPISGEVAEKNVRQAEIMRNNHFFEALLKNKDFIQFCEKRYKLIGHHEQTTLDFEEELISLEEDDDER
jgi:hypothetical protein